MTSEEYTNDKHLQTLEEICENNRAIRRMVNRIVEQLDDIEDIVRYSGEDTVGWSDLYENDESYM